MKIYMFYGSSKHDELQKIHEIYNKSAILMLKKKGMIYELFNALMLVSPAISDTIWCKANKVEDIAMVVKNFI